MYLNSYYKSFQKLCIKISNFASKRKKHAFLYPFLISCWLKANMMAGSGAAIMSQETEITVEDGLTIRQREPVSLTLHNYYTLRVLTI